MASELEVGDVKATNKVVVTKNQQSTTGTPFSGAAIKVLPANTTNTTGVSSLALSTSTVDNYGYLISGHRAGSDGGPSLRISRHSSSDTGTEVLTIDSTGQSTFTRDGLAVVSNRTGSDGDAIHVRKDNYTRLRLTTLGITLPNGGTAPVAAANNRLDYYGEGTWTPSLPNGGTLTINSATYTRIGNICHLQFYVASISPTANTSQFRIGGLPFTVSDDTNYFPAGSIGYAGSGQFVNYRLVGNNNSTVCYFHTVAGDSVALSNNGFITQFSGSNDSLVCSLTYRIK